MKPALGAFLPPEEVDAARRRLAEWRRPPTPATPANGRADEPTPARDVRTSRTSEAPESTGPGPGDDERDVLRLTLQGAARRFRVDGARFILDTPAEVQAVWGEGSRVLWPKGEPLMVNGPTGVGKTTITQQVVLARLGLRSEVLGFPVEPDERRVLYIAADRPSQAARSFRRMVTEADRDVLAERLEVWRGPLPYDLAKRPDVLVTMAEEFDAGTVVVDSLKDVAVKLTDDEVGARVNQALQLATVAGVEVAALHHQRKAQAGAGKPNHLADVYGSVWLTAGAGSVLLVWGEAGDAIVELTHLKQPAEDVGPLTLRHDHERGATVVEGGADVWRLVQAGNGVTVPDVAKAMFSTLDPKPNQLEKARRRLERLVADGKAHRRGGEKDATGRQTVARYYAVTMA